MLNYTELSKLTTFHDRLLYLRGKPGKLFQETFGGLRHLNQAFYTSPQWRSIRSQVIVRDRGFDLGISDVPITGKIVVHHMNLIEPQMLMDSRIELCLDPEYLISVSEQTHRRIHFGDKKLEVQFIDRKPGDTKLW